MLCADHNIRPLFPYLKNLYKPFLVPQNSADAWKLFKNMEFHTPLWAQASVCTYNPGRSLIATKYCRSVLYRKLNLELKLYSHGTLLDLRPVAGLKSNKRQMWRAPHRPGILRAQKTGNTKFEQLFVPLLVRPRVFQACNYL